MVSGIQTTVFQNDMTILLMADWHWLVCVQSHCEIGCGGASVGLGQRMQVQMYNTSLLLGIRKLSLYFHVVRASRSILLLVWSAVEGSVGTLLPGAV